VGDVDALFVITDQSAPSDHPSEGAFYDPSARQDLEALLVIRATDHLDNEVEIAGLVHEFEPVIGTIGEEMLHPGPALANAGHASAALPETSMSTIPDIEGRRSKGKFPPAPNDAHTLLNDPASYTTSGPMKFGTTNPCLSVLLRHSAP